MKIKHGFPFDVKIPNKTTRKTFESTDKGKGKGKGIKTFMIEELRKEILSGFGKSIGAALKKKGVTEEKLLADFKAHRKARRR